MKTKLYLPLALVALAALQPALLPGQNISPAAGSTPNLQQQIPDGFVMVGGKTYKVRNGVATPLQEDVVLRVTPNGIIGLDQVPRKIPANYMLALDGRVIAAPPGLTFPPVQVVTVDPRLQDRGIFGQNLSGLAPSRTAVSSGPRNIIAKKRPVMKSQKTTSSVSSKRASTERETLVFSDELIPLPNRGFEDFGTVNPTIDAGSTMLNMTAAPVPMAPPEVPGIAASLGVSVNPGDALMTTRPMLPMPVIPLPATLSPIPSLTLPPPTDSLPMRPVP